MKTIIAALTIVGSAGLSHAQTTATKNWSGSATCEVAVTGSGYKDQQTHQWTITGGAPTKSGAFDIYPGTWSVTGGGTLERTQGSQTVRAEWTRSVTGMGAPISVVVRASDGAILIQSGHAQLRAKNAVTGTQEVLIDGKVKSQVPIGLEAFEYAFPSSRGAAKSTQISGQKSDAPVGSFGPMQPAASRVQVTCRWNFHQGGAAGQPQSSSAASGAVSTPAGGGHPTLTPAGTATPTAAPTGASADAGPPPVDSSTESTPPTDCNQLLSDIAAQYQNREASIQQMYAKLLQDNAANRTQLDAQLAALLNAKKSSNPAVQAQIKALEQQIKELDAERAKIEDDQRKALAQEQKEAVKADSVARKQCEAAKSAH